MTATDNAAVSVAVPPVAALTPPFRVTPEHDNCQTADSVGPRTQRQGRVCLAAENLICNADCRPEGRPQFTEAGGKAGEAENVPAEPKHSEMLKSGHFSAIYINKTGASEVLKVKAQLEVLSQNLYLSGKINLKQISVQINVFTSVDIHHSIAYGLYLIRLSCE